MTQLHEPRAMIDTHQHLWKVSERAYDWISPDDGILHGDFGPEDVAADIAAAGITGTVLVQAADTYEDSFYMLSVASTVPTIVGVVAWAPLDRTAEATAALDLYATSPWVKGIRVLNHTYEDPRWLVRPDATETISLLAPRRLALDVVSVIDEHLELLPELSSRHPDLTIVIDHMAKPPIATKGWEPWASLIAVAAAAPNVTVKLSGLNTASAEGWTFEDWKPYVDHIVAAFGADRVMLGSDWPVALLAGDFVRVWRAQREVISHLAESEQDDILYRTAQRVYNLGNRS
jgi:L-fuconolactonase